MSTANHRFVVRLPGDSDDLRAYIRPTRTNDKSGAEPTASPHAGAFESSPGDFPALGSVSGVQQERNALGAWSDRVQPGVYPNGPVPRQNARSVSSCDFEFEDHDDVMESNPIPTHSLTASPPAQHVVAPSPSPSDTDAAELADAIVGMDFEDDGPMRNCGLSANAQEFIPMEGNSEDAAYWRICAEHWYSVCMQMQTHIASGVAFCHTLPDPPAV